MSVTVRIPALAPAFAAAQSRRVRMLVAVLTILPVVTAAQSPFGGGASVASPDSVKPTDAAPARKMPREKSISVVLPIAKDKAVDVVTGALLDGGYSIATTSPALVETAELPRYGSGSGLVLRANVVGYADGDSTRIVLTGTFFSYLTRAFSRVLAGNQYTNDMKSGDNIPVEHYRGGVQAKLWQRLVDAAATIQKAGGGHVLVTDSVAAP